MENKKVLIGSIIFVFASFFLLIGLLVNESYKAKKMKEGSHLIRRQQCIFVVQPSKGGERG